VPSRPARQDPPSVQYNAYWVFLGQNGRILVLTSHSFQVRVANGFELHSGRPSAPRYTCYGMTFTLKPPFVLLRFRLHHLRRMKGLIHIPTSATGSFYSIPVRTLIPPLQTTSDHFRPFRIYLSRIYYTNFQSLDVQHYSCLLHNLLLFRKSFATPLVSCL